VSAQATKANIEVRLKTAEGLPEIKADTQQLQQVFLNIVLNAIQGMPDGGKLNIVGAKEGNYIQIRFEDTGPGIPPEDMKRIFDPFFSTKKDGTGLGLSIAHRIVAAHKGKIEVESSVGKGSTFIVKLPICEERDEKGHHIGDR
jgi:signal transduction histidine kinase